VSRAALAMVHPIINGVVMGIHAGALGCAVLFNTTAFRPANVENDGAHFAGVLYYRGGMKFEYCVA
jgi:hypothetical protein